MVPLLSLCKQLLCFTGNKHFCFCISNTDHRFDESSVHCVILILLRRCHSVFQQVSLCPVLHHRPFQDGGEDPQHRRHTVSAGLLRAHPLYPLRAHQNLGWVGQTYSACSDFIVASKADYRLIIHVYLHIYNIYAAFAVCILFLLTHIY